MTTEEHVAYLKKEIARIVPDHIGWVNLETGSPHMVDMSQVRAHLLALCLEAQVEFGEEILRDFDGTDEVTGSKFVFEDTILPKIAALNAAKEGK